MIIHQEKKKKGKVKEKKRYDLCAWNFSVSVHGNLNKQQPKEINIYFF